MTIRLQLSSSSIFLFVFVACVTIDYQDLGDRQNGVATSKANYKAFLSYTDYEKFVNKKIPS